MREGKGARANPTLETLLCLFGSGMSLFLAVVIELGWSPKTTVLISKLIAVVFLMTVALAYGYPALGHPRGVC